MLRPHRILVWTALVAFLLGGSVVNAQSSIPDAVRMAQPLTNQHEATVRAYVQAHLGQLGSDSAATAQAARDRLIQPVDGQTSVGFRIFYSQQVMPALERMVGPQADVQRSQLAMTVAASIATDAARSLLTAQLEDERPAVRLGAARELGVLLGHYDKGQGFAAIQQDSINPLIERIRRGVAEDDNMLVAAELAKALVAPSQTAALQDQALRAMCAGMAAQIQARLGEAADTEDVFEWIVATLRTMRDAHVRLINRQIAGGAPAEVNSAAANFARAARDFAEAVQGNPHLNEDGRIFAGRLKTAADNLLQITTGLGG